MGIKAANMKSVMALLFLVASVAAMGVKRDDLEPGEMPMAAEVHQPGPTVEGAQIKKEEPRRTTDNFVQNWDKSSKQQWDLEDKEEQDMQTDLSKLAADVNGFQSMMKNFKAEQKKIREHYEFKIRDLESENQKLKKELEAAKKDNSLLIESRNRVQQAMQLINGVSGVAKS